MFYTFIECACARDENLCCENMLLTEFVAITLDAQDSTMGKRNSGSGENKGRDLRHMLGSPLATKKLEYGELDEVQQEIIVAMGPPLPPAEDDEVSAELSLVS